MAKRMVRNVSAALLFAACSSAFGIENNQPLPAAANELLQMYPGTRVHQEQNRVRIIYGMPMTPGVDARNASQNWIQMHGAAFGCGNLEVREAYHVPFSDGSKTAISYQQFINGIPVEYGTLKVLVLNGAVPQVVSVGGNLAPAPAEAFAAPALTGDMAVQLVRSMQSWRRVPQWSKAELVVFQGNGDWVAPTLAWKFVGEDPNVSAALRKTFFVNANTGVLVHVRDEVLTIDVTGSLKGWGSPGLLPDEPYNPPSLLNIPDMRAAIGGGNNVFSDSGGLFSIPHAGTAPVTVSATTSGGGRWVTAVPVSGGTVSGSVNVTPPGPADLILNAVPAELLTAQINAFVCTTATHNYFKSRAPAFTGLDIAIPANTGVSGSCNAFFNGSSINFYNRLNGCANTAFTTVVSHEYGHFIVNRLGLTQNAFGEGYGDVTAMLIWDDHIVGRGFRQTQTSFVRDPFTANIQYPCSAGAIHTCGQILGGVWWRIRLAMGAFYGSQAGLEQTRQLHVNWSLATDGGVGTFNSAHPVTAIEVLEADDNDGNISNGTPNYSRICESFAAHGIQCPPLSLLTFQYPSGRPAQVTPNQPTQISVNVVASGASPQAGTGTVSYRVGSGSFTTVPMVEGSPNQYTATLPAASCGQDINYYFSALTTTSTLASDPNNAPTSFFTAGATIGTSNTTVVSHDFNTDPGWTVVNDPSLTSGAWERVTPTAGAGTGTPTAAFGGSGMCWVTDNRSGNFDVDGGPTTLLSSVYNLSAYPRVTVSYQRWLYSTANDPWTFQYSTNGGTTWTVLESVTGTTSAAWTARSFDIAAPTSTMRFRWTLSDNPNDSVAEGGIDQFSITGLICPSGCYANCDGSTAAPVLNVNDFVCFQNLYAAGSSVANCDGSTSAPVLNVNDFVCFQNLYAAGCS